MFIKNITDGIRGLACGMIIAVAVPGAVIKTVIGNAVRKKKAAAKELKVTEKYIDVNKLDNETKNKIKKMYAVKNGSPCE